MIFFLPTKMGSARRVCKFIAPPKGKLLLFSIGAFLYKYDITNRKQQKSLIYSIGAKTTFWEQKQVNGDYWPSPTSIKEEEEVSQIVQDYLWSIHPDISTTSPQRVITKLGPCLHFCESGCFLNLVEVMKTIFIC